MKNSPKTGKFIQILENSQNFKISNFQKSEKQFSKTIFCFFFSFPNILSYARFQSASRQPDTVPHQNEFSFWTLLS